MLNIIQKSIDKYIDETKLDVKVESYNLYDGKKLEYTLSVLDYMASVEVLADYTYDFFILETQNENMFICKTRCFLNFDDLLEEIKKDLTHLLSLKKRD